MELTLNQKLSLIQKEFKASKSKFNSFGKYNFRSAEDILEALKPFNEKYGVSFIISEVLIDFKNTPYIELQDKNGKYNAPTAYGYGIDIKQQSLEEFKYPDGTFWINEIQPEVSSGRESGIDYTPTFSPKMNFKPFCGIMASAFTCYDNESCKEINYKIIE